MKTVQHLAAERELSRPIAPDVTDADDYAERERARYRDLMDLFAWMEPEDRIFIVRLAMGAPPRRSTSKPTTGPA